MIAAEKQLLASRYVALLVKEFRQMLRDRQLVSLLVIPPVIQLMLYGFALSPDVEHLRLAVFDLSKSPASRRVVSALTNSRVFDVKSVPASLPDLAGRVAAGKVDAGMIIPPEFERLAKQGKSAPVQFLLDGVDANTAGIAAGFITQILGALDLTESRQQKQAAAPLAVDVSFAYNPGLVSSWFFVPGVLGLVVVIAGTLVSTISVIREKDTGTLEQLLMTPAEPAEILAAKLVPLIFFLLGSLMLGLFMGAVVFHLPVRGSFLILVFISVIAVLVAVSVGMALATFAGNQRQAILTSFFINFPLIMLSGAIAPIESMPAFFKYLSLLDPLRYYVSALRAILLKGVGIEYIWQQVAALLFFSVLLFSLSATKFREHLQ